MVDTPELGASGDAGPRDGVGRRLAAAGLSLLIPGGGHVVRGRLVRGVAWCAATTVALFALPWTGPAGFVIAFGGRLAAAPLDAALCRRGPARSLLLPLLVLAGVVAVSTVVTRAALVEGLRAPSSSMSPAIEIGDTFYIDKVHTDAAVGDVIVFRHPQSHRDYVKRVVGRAGDRIAVRGGVLYRNGEAMAQGSRRPCRFADRDEGAGTWSAVDVLCADEDLAGRRHAIMLDSHSPDPAVPGLHDFPPPGDDGVRFERGGQASPLEPDGSYRVPPGHLFVMGDNRDNSNDSRSWGPVPVGNVRGTALYVWWSRGPSGVRWDRLGHVIR